MKFCSKKEVIYKPTGDDMLLGFMKRHYHYRPTFIARQINLKSGSFSQKTAVCLLLSFRLFSAIGSWGEKRGMLPPLLPWWALQVWESGERAREREGDVCCVSETGKVIRTHDRGCNESVFLLQCIVLTLFSDLFLLSLARHTCCASHVSISLSSRFSLPLSPCLHQCSTSRPSEIVA